MKESIDQLEAWADYFGGWGKVAGSVGGYNQYLSPEEKILESRSVSDRKWSEQDLVRIDALVAVMGLDASTMFFKRVILAHYLKREDPAVFCRRERLVRKDYGYHLERSIKVFMQLSAKWELTPTKSIRTMSLNNLKNAVVRPARALNYA
jgi:hypothetical protein